MSDGRDASLPFKAVVKITVVAEDSGGVGRGLNHVLLQHPTTSALNGDFFYTSHEYPHLPVSLHLQKDNSLPSAFTTTTKTIYSKDY